MGEMRYDGDRVQCHLCGRWFKMVGGNHTISAHDMTVAEYRELFRLNGNVSTVAPETAERKRETMLAQIASGERDQSVLGRPAPPTVPKWRSLMVLHPQLMDEWHPTRNRDLDPYNVGQCSRSKIWWRCRECGHEWQATPHDRAHSGRGCPACARRRRIAATIERNRRAEVRPERTLAVVRPQLLKEWHPTRNGEVIRSESRRPRSGPCGGGAASGIASGSGGRWLETGRSTAHWAARAARIDSPASVGRARILADHSERSIPTCSTSGTQPRTGSLIHTRSSRDRSGVCGGSARTAGGIGRRRRCRAVIACSGAAQRARSGWRAESSLSARTSAAL